MNRYYKSNGQYVEEITLAQIRADAIDELFNTKTFSGHTLKDLYEKDPVCERDYGWDACFETFEEVAERLKEIGI